MESVPFNHLSQGFPRGSSLGMPARGDSHELSAEILSVMLSVSRDGSQGSAAPAAS
jgi:hypothetical protein